jgi:hypothetical protein
VSEQSDGQGMDESVKKDDLMQRVVIFPHCFYPLFLSKNISFRPATSSQQRIASSQQKRVK